MPGREPRTWHLFCRVVDNFGDAGVCWRLARELAAEHALDVTLFIDRVDALARIEPAIASALPVQEAAGVRVHRLVDDLEPRIADVAVEAFGCGLPPRYVAAMAIADPKPAWIVLEYLSAEPWVDAAHALPSPHPALPLMRHFWFPGFTPQTGGLVRERGLLARRDRWQAAHHRADDALRIVLFTYENAALPALLERLANGREAIACLVPERVAADSLRHWLGASPPSAGGRVVRGSLTLDFAAFTTQDGFDRRLWDADVNFVRGEDSFVRAQWAARPFVWQPYRQAGRAHRGKLAAFLARYAAGLPPRAAQAVIAFWHAFDDEDAAAAPAAWDAFRAELPLLARHGRTWADACAALPELGARLVEFVRDRL